MRGRGGRADSVGGNGSGRMLQTLVAELERDPSLDDPRALRRRVEALDHLEALMMDGRDQGPPARHTIEAALRDRARAVHARLEAVNGELFGSIRREIRRGNGAAQLLRWAPRRRPDGRADAAVSGEGYDHLDVLLAGVLQAEPCDAEVAEPGPEMVPYQPTPARHVFDLIDRAALTSRDVLVDLGAGLGRVPLLASICSAARGVGIELEAAYVECARRNARALDLTNVTFIQQDARVADLSDGTVFYLFTPFVGGVLRAVLDSLHHEAAGREIRVCTLGPCTPIVAGEVVGGRRDSGGGSRRRVPLSLVGASCGTLRRPLGMNPHDMSQSGR